MEIFKPELSITRPPPQGDYIATVKYIQQSLNIRYKQSLVPDGIWGWHSQSALTCALQTELNCQYGANIPITPEWSEDVKQAIRPLRIGARGNLVWVLQSALCACGFSVAPDGIWGSKTESSIRNFQRANGLEVDGVAEHEIFEKLLTRLSTPPCVT